MINGHMLKNKMYFESNFCSNPICYSEKNQKVAQVNFTVNQIITHSHDVSTGEFIDSKRAESITVGVTPVNGPFNLRMFKRAYDWSIFDRDGICRQLTTGTREQFYFIYLRQQEKSKIKK